MRVYATFFFFRSLVINFLGSHIQFFYSSFFLSFSFSSSPFDHQTMPVPFFWICMGITSVAIGALVYFEASHRYNEYREWQEYQRYAHAHTSTRDGDYYDKNNGFDDKNSDDDHDNQDDKHKKAFVRKLQDDDHELRRRPQRPTTGAAETSASTTSDYSGSSNRPVADKVT